MSPSLPPTRTSKIFFSASVLWSVRLTPICKKQSSPERVLRFPVYMVLCAARIVARRIVPMPRMMEARTVRGSTVPADESGKTT